MHSTSSRRYGMTYMAAALAQLALAQNVVGADGGVIPTEPGGSDRIQAPPLPVAYSDRIERRRRTKKRKRLAFRP